MIYFFAAVGVMTCVTIVGAVLLWLLTTDKDEILESILYDDPGYFNHEEPEWLRREDEE